jgi:transcriptional regulator with XRE-family HTH domain
VSTDDNEAIGARLREIRQAKGLSAREAAERAGVTPAYLSRLETGKLSPTVASLSRVMQALGEPVAALFGTGDASDSPVVRRADRQVVRSHGVDDFRVTPSWADRLEILETVISPGRGSGPQPYAHPGDQECVVVLDGSLTMWLAEAEYRLEVGDSITFSCRVPHRWRNPGRSQARLLWVITPSTY